MGENRNIPAADRISGTGTLAGGRAITKLPAGDLDRARAFYEEKLGLVPVEERAGGLRYLCAGGEFHLFLSTGAPSGEFTQMGCVEQPSEFGPDTLGDAPFPVGSHLRSCQHGLILFRGEVAVAGEDLEEVIPRPSLRDLPVGRVSLAVHSCLIKGGLCYPYPFLQYPFA
jgi:catechol 2,3-dioxygenase-like lactoylglutathione lyase family enzyme